MTLPMGGFWLGRQLGNVRFPAAYGAKLKCTPHLRNGAFDPSETCAALDFCGAHWALSLVSLLAIFCFDDGS
jgi:hypothetical protein